jgi:hypothetical protein
LLNENSPTKFSKEVGARLRGGEIALPGSPTRYRYGASDGYRYLEAGQAGSADIKARQAACVW